MSANRIIIGSAPAYSSSSMPREHITVEPIGMMHSIPNDTGRIQSSSLSLGTIQTTPRRQERETVTSSTEPEWYIMDVTESHYITYSETSAVPTTIEDDGKDVLTPHRTTGARTCGARNDGDMTLLTTPHRTTVTVDIQDDRDMMRTPHMLTPHRTTGARTMGMGGRSYDDGDVTPHRTLAATDVLAAYENDSTRSGDTPNRPSVAMQVIRDLDTMSLGLGPHTREPITTAELQATGISRAEADRMAARQNSQVNLQRRLTQFFRIWTFISVFFGTSTIVSLFILMLNYDKRPPGSETLQWWSEVVFASHLYSIFLHRFVLRKCCAYRPEEDNRDWPPEPLPRRVKYYKILRTIFGIGWSILGIVLAHLPHDSDAITNAEDWAIRHQFARAVLFYSIFNLCLYFHLIVVISVPHWVMQYAYNMGIPIPGNPDAAPKGTAEKLETVDMTKPLGMHFIEIAHDGCSICMEEFNPKKVVVKKTECNHYFHFKCINNWLQVSRHCPLCRKDLVLDSTLEAQGDKPNVIGSGHTHAGFDGSVVENV